MALAPKKLSLEQFLALPEEEPALEYDHGMVTQKMSPKGQHSALQSEFIELINRFGRPLELARAFPELRISFGGVSHVPDVAVFSWDRIPRDESGKIANDVFEPPDITVEIISPGQSTTALVRRSLWYVANGVQLALVVDPVDESILAFRADGAPVSWQGEDRIDLGEVLPGFGLTAEELFAALR